MSQVDQSVPSGCESPMQVVADALHYFGQHFSEPIQIPSMAESLGISLDCLNFSFEHIRGVTPLQALQEHRLNKLFFALTDQPRQDLGRAIRACGLAETTGGWRSSSRSSASTCLFFCSPAAVQRMTGCSAWSTQKQMRWYCPPKTTGHSLRPAEASGTGSGGGHRSVDG